MSKDFIEQLVIQFPTLNNWADWTAALILFALVWLTGAADSMRIVVERQISWLANPLGIILIFAVHGFITWVLFNAILTTEVLLQ